MIGAYEETSKSCTPKKNATINVSVAWYYSELRTLSPLSTSVVWKIRSFWWAFDTGVSEAQLSYIAYNLLHFNLSLSLSLLFSLSLSLSLSFSLSLSLSLSLSFLRYGSHWLSRSKLTSFKLRWKSNFFVWLFKIINSSQCCPNASLKIALQETIVRS